LTEMQGHLKLRVTVEVWRLLMDFAVDVCLFVSVGIGFLIINPDIFGDIKVALPFFPAAVSLLAIALVLRVLYGAREAGRSTFKAALLLMTISALLNAIGYTFVMEAAPGEWLAGHPSGFWSALRGWRSNENLERSMTVFWIFGPLMYGVLLWAIVTGIRRLFAARAGGE